MPVRCRRFTVILWMGLACTHSADSRREPGLSPPLQKRAMATVPLGSPVRLAEAPFLPSCSVTFFRDGAPLAYREADVPVRMEKDRIIFQLQSLRGDAPEIHYEIRESADHLESAVRFWSNAPLPELSIQSVAPPQLLPVRLQGPEDSILSIAGPALFASCDALYDPRRDYAVTIDQPFQYSPASQPRDTGLLGIRISPGTAREAQINFRLNADVGRSRFRAEGPRMIPSTAPAEWCLLQPAGEPAPGGDDPAVWARANLGIAPGALSAIPAAGGLPAMWCSGPNAGANAAGQGGIPGPDWKRRFDKCRDIHGRVLERGERYNWQHAKELLAATLDDYWAHGLVSTNTAVPLLLGPPLSIEHARMWASLAGLGGQGVVIGGDPRALPEERLELLRAILPPAPVRNGDLFPHGLPRQWVVTCTRQWKYAEGVFLAEPLLAVGLFNWSLEPQLITVRLADLMPSLAARGAAADAAPFAVYDCWRSQLFSVTRQDFQVPLAPASGRVFRVIPLTGDRPQLVSSSPRLVQTQLDAAELAWDAATHAVHARSTVAADQPLELSFVVPEGPESFEVDQVTAGAAATVRSTGLVRFVTLQSPQGGEVRWSARFRPAAQRLEAPAPPAGLSASQNTRGVLLKWHRDEPAPLYQIYRNDQPIGRTCEPEFQDSSVRYGPLYTYTVTAVDAMGRESARPAPLNHQTPLPASTNLTDLVPLTAEQEHLAVMSDTSAAGNPLHIAGKRYHRGLGTHSNARIVYFLGGGYRTFTGEVGIDDETQGRGSCIFKILADGQPLFTSRELRGGEPAQPFSVPVADRLRLELIVTQGSDHPDHDHADWGNPYLESNPR